jgi:8-oxo-dGTP pyrophosphatase MutT (NUDIX family)
MRLFKKLPFLCIMLLAILKIDAAEPGKISLGEASAVQVETVISESLKKLLDEFEHKLDAYKNICIILNSPSSEAIAHLQAIMEEMGKSYMNHGLYVHIPVSCGEFSAQLETLGFKLCELNTDTKTLIYLYRNGRNIPELNYAYTAAAVYLLRTNPETRVKEILIINEPLKTIANIIGGISEKGESPEETVVRETFEEVGIKITKEKLKLVAVFHTVRADKKACIEFLYVCDKFEGVPKVDGAEVSECVWVPLSELLKDGAKVFGKPFYPLWQKILKSDFKAQEYGQGITFTKKVYQHFSPIE